VLEDNGKSQGSNTIPDLIIFPLDSEFNSAIVYKTLAPP
jgi:hypothetical protein